MPPPQKKNGGTIINELNKGSQWKLVLYQGFILLLLQSYFSKKSHWYKSTPLIAYAVIDSLNIVS